MHSVTMGLQKLTPGLLDPFRGSRHIHLFSDHPTSQWRQIK